LFSREMLITSGALGRCDLCDVFHVDLQ